MHRRQYTVSFGAGQGPMPFGIKWLLIANVAVFLFQSILGLLGGGAATRFVMLFGLIPPFNPIPDISFQVWQPLTYLFLHGGILHLGFNMFMLWMFGTQLERQWGAREFLRYYFICGIGAAAMTCLLAIPFAPFRSPTIGASGAILGLLLAYGYLWPNNQILVWGIFPMRAWTMVMIFGGVELYSLVFAGGQSNIAYAAHVGGMLVGYLYLKRAWRLGSLFSDLRWRLRRRRFRVMDRRDDDFPFH
jgi:membrane associated rhomboid family serine protease